LCLFAAMLLLTVWAGQYSRSLGKERGSFQVILGSEASRGAGRPAILDLADQGYPKRLVQPNQVSITTGHRGGITNMGLRPIWLQVRAEGFAGTARATSTDPTFRESEGRLGRPLQPKQSFSMSLDLEIPRDRLQCAEVSSGVLRFTDYKTGQLLAEVPVKVINSNSCKGDTCPCGDRKPSSCSVERGI
jgi:hypothetical protein